MAAGKRSNRLSRRDIEVLGFIARFGVVPRSAVAAWAGTGRSVTFARERRLREAGLIEVRSAFWGSGMLALATPAGLRSTGCKQLGRARFCAASVGHEAAVAELAARMERQGTPVLSEREIAAQEKAEGQRLLSIRLGEGRFHRCDLIAVGEPGSAPEAIEVELTAKGKARLDQLLRAWRLAVGEGRFSCVLYRCPPSTRALVQRAVKRTRTAEFVRVQAL